MPSIIEAATVRSPRHRAGQEEDDGLLPRSPLNGPADDASPLSDELQSDAFSASPSNGETEEYIRNLDNDFASGATAAAGGRAASPPSPAGPAGGGAALPPSPPGAANGDGSAAPPRRRGSGFAALPYLLRRLRRPERPRRPRG